ncbi:hypothetical protein PQR15_33660 [Streptomyces lydicus]|nr:hypothetical protein [Streptomyces lydicus]
MHGTDRVEAVTLTRLDHDWRPLPGTGVRIPCDALAVGHGLVPQLEPATGLGCATRRTPDGGHALVVDGRQRTTVGGIWAAGRPAASPVPNSPSSKASWRPGRSPAGARSAHCGGAGTGCAGSRWPWRPSTRRAPAGPTGCAPTPRCAAARRSPQAGSRTP